MRVIIAFCVLLLCWSLPGCHRQQPAESWGNPPPATVENGRTVEAKLMRAEKAVSMAIVKGCPARSGIRSSSERDRDMAFLQAGKPATHHLEESKVALQRFVSTGRAADWSLAWRSLERFFGSVESWRSTKVWSQLVPADQKSELNQALHDLETELLHLASAKSPTPD